LVVDDVDVFGILDDDSVVVLVGVEVVVVVE
jgi:hypothetical protein